MFMSILSHILSAWFAFLLPSYATFKALSHRPLSEPELQRWAMYWSVVGVFVAFEYTAEWLISWLPFYWEVKTLFLLYLSLPQTQASPRPLPNQHRVIRILTMCLRHQGSTFIYTTYLQPFFTQNEGDLDEGIVQVQKNVLTFVQTRLTALWESILNAANKRQATTSTAAGSSNTSASPNGNASALQSVFGLWQTHGTSVLSALGTKGTTVSAVPSTSPSSVQGASGGAAQRGGTEAHKNNRSNGDIASPASTPSENNPSFPEPYNF